MVKSIPFANVDDAVVDFIFNIPSTESPPANVEVPWPAPTVIAAAKVLVAVVEVANIELKNPWDAESWVVEARFIRADVAKKFVLVALPAMSEVM